MASTNSNRKFNPYEYIARQRKVDVILSNIPNGASRRHNIGTARLLRSWSQSDRDVFARNAGANSPSNETWKLVVEAVEERKVA